MSKNYLFAPFKDDDDKIGEFNAVVNALKYVLADTCPSLTDTEKEHYMESALHGLRVFIGRLESYYDVIVSELQAESIEQIKDNKRLKGLLDMDSSLDDAIIKDAELIRELKAENDKLKYDLKYSYKDNEELIKENEELKQGLFTSDVDELKAENKRNVDKFEMRVDALKNEVEEGRAENVRLMKQVSSNRDSNSNTHTHATSKEIDEYIDNNHITKAYIFVVDADGVNDNGFIADSHAVSTIHDNNCVAIHNIE